MKAQTLTTEHQAALDAAAQAVRDAQAALDAADLAWARTVAAVYTDGRYTLRAVADAIGRSATTTHELVRTGRAA